MKTVSKYNFRYTKLTGMARMGTTTLSTHPPVIVVVVGVALDNALDRVMGSVARVC
jgi:hypothetical protein